MALSNLLVTNNVLMNVTTGINLTGADTNTNVDIINNSFYDGTAGIIIEGTLDAGKIVNNALDGNGSDSTAVAVGTVSSSTIDYNVVYDYDAAYGGAASAGSNSNEYDPLFVSPTDLKLQSRSPAIDAGAGSGTYAEVPSTDYRAQSRPIDITGYYNADNGTDIGAYEMLAAEAPFSAVSFYLDAGGSDTAPYDSLAKAATSLYEFFNQSTPGPTGPAMKVFPSDYLEVSSLGGAITDTWVAGPMQMASCIMRAYSGNSTRPTVNLLKGGTFGWQAPGGKVYDIDFAKDGSGPGPANNAFFHPAPGAGDLDHFEIIDCSLIITGATAWAGPGPIYLIGSTSTVTSLIIKNNLLSGCGEDVINMDYKAPNGEIINNTLDGFYDIASSNAVGVIDIVNTGDVSNGLKIVNNIVNANGGSANFGINIIGTDLSDQNFNCIYGAFTEYGGAATAGSFNIHADPSFVGGGDFKLTLDTPCVDSGAGTDLYSGVPADDIRGTSRPQVIPTFPNIDNGTDIGCYEMLASELTSTTYYVNASGSNIAPYDSSNTGAINFDNLVANVSFTSKDIVEVIQDGGEVNDSTSDINIARSIVVRSDSSANKATVIVNDSTNMFSFVSGAVSPVVQNLKMYKAGPDATSNFIHFGDYALTAPEVSGCEFWVADTSNADAKGIVFTDNTINSTCVINGNDFDGLSYSLFSDSTNVSGGLAPKMGHVSRLNTKMVGTFISAPAPA